MYDNIEELKRALSFINVAGWQCRQGWFKKEDRGWNKRKSIL